MLLYDAYHSHLGLRVLQLMEGNGIVVYALPVHTSRMTQPLDVRVFGPFKEHLRNLVEGLSGPTSTNFYDSFDFLKVI